MFLSIMHKNSSVTENVWYVSRYRYLGSRHAKNVEYPNTMTLDTCATISWQKNIDTKQKIRLEIYIFNWLVS